ncbi:ATP-binding protein [Streptomyces sp. NPDC054796]
MPPTTAAELIHDQGLGELVAHHDLSLVAMKAPQKVVRGRVRSVLGGRTSKDAIDRAVLVADELVGNAMQHAGGPVALTLDVYEKGAAVRVTDRGTDTEAVPADLTELCTAPLLPEPEEIVIDEISENGRGLLFVALLAVAWTVEKSRLGKVVTAVVLTGDGQ